MIITLTPESLPAGVTSFPTTLMAATAGMVPSTAYASVHFPVPAEGDQPQLFTTTFLRGGSLVGADSTFFGAGSMVQYDYLNAGIWSFGALVGADNYIGIGVSDEVGNTYYGYLQFHLHEVVLGDTSIQVLGGALSTVANQAILIPAVPEPSVWALGLSGAALAVVAARRKMRKAA